MGTIIMLVVMIGLLWFMQRSQRKQAQERQDQLNALNKGDEIISKIIKPQVNHGGKMIQAAQIEVSVG